MYHHYGISHMPYPDYGTHLGYGYQPYGLGHYHPHHHIHHHYHHFTNHFAGPVFAVPFGSR